jgi:hypothetical protein
MGERSPVAFETTRVPPTQDGASVQARGALAGEVLVAPALFRAVQAGGAGRVGPAEASAVHLRAAADRRTGAEARGCMLSHGSLLRGSRTDCTHLPYFHSLPLVSNLSQIRRG